MAGRSGDRWVTLAHIVVPNMAMRGGGAVEETVGMTVAAIGR